MTLLAIDDDVTRRGETRRCSNRFRLDLACSMQALIWRRWVRRTTLADYRRRWQSAPRNRPSPSILPLAEICRFLQFFDSSAYRGRCIHLDWAFQSLNRRCPIHWNRRSNVWYRQVGTFNGEKLCEIRRSLQLFLVDSPMPGKNWHHSECLFRVVENWPNIVLTVEIFYEFCIRTSNSLSRVHIDSFWGWNLSHVIVFSIAFQRSASLVSN